MPAHHTGISVVPEVITDGAPSGIDTHLHPSYLFSCTTREPNFFIGAGYYQLQHNTMNTLKGTRGIANISDTYLHRSHQHPDDESSSTPHTYQAPGHMPGW